MDFSDRARSWEDDPDRVRRSAEVADAIRGALGLTARPRTLELGAGTGLLSRQLADLLGPTVLSDSSPGMVEVAAEKIAELGLAEWSATVVPADAVELPPGPFDLILTQLALHHMAHVAGVLRAAHDVLVPGGQIAVADLDRDPEGHFHAEHADFHGHHGFGRDEVAHLLGKAGFADVTVATATVLEKVVRDETRGFPLFLATARRP